MPPRCGLPQHVKDRVPSVRLCTLNQCLAETNLFDFFGSNAVTGNVSNSIRRPDELANPHSLILHLILVALLPARPQSNARLAGSILLLFFEKLESFCNSFMQKLDTTGELEPAPFLFRFV